MSTRVFLIGTLSLLTATACGSYRQDPAVEVSAEDANLNSRWNATIASPASLAGVVQMNGTASMAPSPDGTSTGVTLQLGNASPGGLHPRAAHRGQCGTGTDNGVFGTNEMYQPILSDKEGRVDVAASIPQYTPTSGRYFVVIYASAANSETIVACGNFAAPTR